MGLYWLIGSWPMPQVRSSSSSMAWYSEIVGIFFGFLCNLVIVIYVDNSSKVWRILTNTTLIPTIPLLVMIYLMPESPRYLMKHGRYEKAHDSFNQVQTTPLLAARDFMYAHAQLDFESRMLKGKAKEFANLADRVELSVPNFSGAASGNSSIRHTPSHTSISPRHSIHETTVDRILQAQSLTNPGSGQQQPIQMNEIASRSERGIVQSDMRRASDVSSLDIDLGIQNTIQAAIQRENPYSYHIGVTGYYKRLGQLWSNMRCRRALLAASIAMISQQMTGVNTIAFLGTIVCKLPC